MIHDMMSDAVLLGKSIHVFFIRTKANRFCSRILSNSLTLTLVLILTLSLINTATAVDTAAPTVPANLSATPVSSSQIKLTWTASTDNVGIASVVVVVNGGTPITATGTTAWSATVPLKSGDNTITVTVTDTAGNTVSKTISVKYSKSSSGKGFIPGFEGVVFLAAALVGLVVLARRKKN